MRGKGYYTDITFDETGITPAYAGKSCKSDNLFSFL